MRSTLFVFSLLFPWCALAQTPPPALPTEAASMAPASEAVAPQSANVSPAEPAPAPLLEGCRSLTDKAMAADLKALTAQAQKMEASALVQLHAVSEGWWTKALEQCEGRAKERAQRNLSENQKAAALLNEQLGNAPECGAAHKDATTLQDLARSALSERRWIDAATLFHKAEDMWDMAAERCTGSQKELAVKRLEQAETDGYNAEFCAPLFDLAREQTKKLRASAAGLSREEKQDGLMVAETLWRDTLAQCKGVAAQESARNNAQTLARERGTPWVARTAAPLPAAAVRLATNATTASAAKPAAVAADLTPKTQVAAPAPSDKAMAAVPGLDPAPAKATTAALASTAQAGTSAGSPALGASFSGVFAAATAAVKPAATLTAPVLATAQPDVFTVGEMRFEGQFVRDADAATFSGRGKLTWANGDVFDGSLQNGKRHGTGLLVWRSGLRYQGDWVDDMPTGQAVIDFPSGDHYEGTAENALPQGAGSMRYASGDHYKGMFVAGEPHGMGVYVWKHGQTFDGEWKGGKPNGQGKMQYANGDVYEGTVRDGAPNQSGTFAWVGGDRYAGQWKAGRKDGQGVFTWANGDRWEGVYESDVQSASGALYRKLP